MTPWALIFSRNSLSRGRSSFRERRHSNINPSYHEQDGRSNRPHWYPPIFMESVTSPSHLTFQILQQTPTSAQTVIEGNGNHSQIQEHNPDHYERIATCRSGGYWNPHDSHCQCRLLGYICTGRSTKKGVAHQKIVENKKETSPKRLTIFSSNHCSMRLPLSSSSAKFTVTYWK